MLDFLDQSGSSCLSLTMSDWNGLITLLSEYVLLLMNGGVFFFHLLLRHVSFACIIVKWALPFWALLHRVRFYRGLSKVHWNNFHSLWLDDLIPWASGAAELVLALYLHHATWCFCHLIRSLSEFGGWPLGASSLTLLEFRRQFKRQFFSSFVDAFLSLFEHFEVLVLYKLIHLVLINLLLSELGVELLCSCDELCIGNVLTVFWSKYRRFSLLEHLEDVLVFGLFLVAYFLECFKWLLLLLFLSERILVSLILQLTSDFIDLVLQYLFVQIRVVVEVFEWTFLFRVSLTIIVLWSLREEHSVVL